MREQDIRDELDNDPNAHGYAAIIGVAGPDDEAVNLALAAELNLADIARNKATMTRQEVLDAVDDAELLAIVDAVDIANIWGVLASDAIDPFGLAQQVFVGAFGGASQTITDLATARAELISRATELSLGFVKPGHVQMARNLP